MLERRHLFPHSFDDNRCTLLEGLASLSFLNEDGPNSEFNHPSLTEYNVAKLEGGMSPTLSGRSYYNQKSHSSSSPSSPWSQRSQPEVDNISLGGVPTDGTSSSSLSIEQESFKTHNFVTSSFLSNDVSNYNGNHYSQPVDRVNSSNHHLTSEWNRHNGNESHVHSADGVHSHQPSSLPQYESNWYTTPNYSVTNEEKSDKYMPSGYNDQSMRESKLSSDVWKRPSFIPEERSRLSGYMSSTEVQTKNSAYENMKLSSYQPYQKVFEYQTATIKSEKMTNQSNSANNADTGALFQNNGFYHRPDQYKKDDMSQHQSPYSNADNTVPSSNAIYHGAKSNVSCNTFVYIVKFKHLQRSFVASPHLARELKVGCYVKVEADRGEDLGIIINCISQGHRNNLNLYQNGYEGNSPNFLSESNPQLSSTFTGCKDTKKIIRLATNDEVTLLSLKGEEENDLLAVCREKALQRSLTMNIIDAEYQFDRNKLTFYFKANGRVDFRELVRDLFSMYKIRIWMQQLDKEN